MAKEIVISIFLIIQLVVFAYLTISITYFLLFSIAGLFSHQIETPSEKKLNRFIVLIPGYKEDFVIVEVAENALLQDYPKEFYDVAVIADSFQPETLSKLNQLPIKVIEVVFEKSSKSKAINKALSVLPNIYDAIIILDADNIMAPDCIRKMNNSLNCGYEAIQGHRTAKNRNTHFAILDSVSEEIGNHIFRKGHRMLGLSSALIGSGMAFRYELFKQVMLDIDSTGEDKELEIKLISDGRKIEYLNDAYIFDEKVQKSEVFMVQRTRWLANQIIYAKKYFFWSVKQLILKGNIDLFDKVMQQFLPPRIFLLGFLIIISILSLLFNPLVYTLAWLSLTVLCIIILLISTPRKYYTFSTIKATLHLPKGFLFMFLALIRIFKARKTWGHTAHGVIEKNDQTKR
jgi:cellulose synthase/poly-beta-1,6-N-acetylglucosamine synthase-like glycosyltransferase